MAETSQEFYHVNRRVSWSSLPLWKVGDAFDFGTKTNPYFSYFETYKFTAVRSKPDGSPVRTRVGAVKYLEEFANGRPAGPDLPRVAHQIAKYFASYLGELIWEDIRRREFPQLPSRQRCLWLTPSIDGAKYWVKRLESASSYQVAKVRVQGRLHKANELYLMGDSEPMTESIKKARQYWSGIIPPGGQEEIIFAGRVKVIEILEPNCLA